MERSHKSFRMIIERDHLTHIFKCSTKIFLEFCVSFVYKLPIFFRRDTFESSTKKFRILLKELVSIFSYDIAFVHRILVSVQSSRYNERHSDQVSFYGTSQGSIVFGNDFSFEVEISSKESDRSLEQDDPDESKCNDREDRYLELYGRCSSCETF